jgi:hypothetical protein
MRPRRTRGGKSGHISGGFLVDSDLRQPIKAWRCQKCGRIDDVEWVGGTHADRTTAGLNGRCDGQPEGPFYLVHVDQYLDVMLAERAR